MEQDNIELVREAIALWNACAMERLHELHDPGVILGAPPDWPEPGPFVGREAVFQQFSQVRDAFDSDTMEIISDPVAHGDRVIVRLIWHGHGRGPESAFEWTILYTVRKGLIVGTEFFRDHGEALELLGLPDAAD